MDSLPPMLRGVLVLAGIVLLFGSVFAIVALVTYVERAQRASALAPYAAARGMRPVSTGETLRPSWESPLLSVLATHASVTGTFDGLRVEVLLSSMRRGWRSMSVVAQRPRALSGAGIGAYRSTPRAGTFSAGAPPPPTFSGRFKLSGPPALVARVFDEDVQQAVVSFPRDLDMVWLDGSIAGMQWLENDPVDPAVVDSALQTICTLCARADAQ
ncbi:MAG TPA: hypothetical protein VNN80_17025 [Polyangiaceae bacterium]|nr:hypothetical protein [Polyangiaceae bacterium]